MSEDQHNNVEGGCATPAIEGSVGVVESTPGEGEKLASSSELRAEDGHTHRGTVDSPITVGTSGAFETPVAIPNSDAGDDDETASAESVDVRGSQGGDWQDPFVPMAKRLCWGISTALRSDQRRGLSIVGGGAGMSFVPEDRDLRYPAYQRIARELASARELEEWIYDLDKIQDEALEIRDTARRALLKLRASNVGFIGRQMGGATDVRLVATEHGNIIVTRLGSAGNRVEIDRLLTTAERKRRAVRRADPYEEDYRRRLRLERQRGDSPVPWAHHDE